MQILLISVTAGISVFLMISGSLSYAEKVRIERRLSGKFSDMKKHRYRGLRGIVIYFSERAGKVLLKLKIKYISDYMLIIDRYLSDLNQNDIITDSHGVMGLQIISGILFAVSGFFVFELRNPALLILFALTGILLPFLYIKEKTKARNLRIFSQLSEFLDAITLMVEAGLDFDSALNRILNTYNGDLIDEFRVVKHEMMLGKSKIKALSGLYNRTSESHLKSVLNGLVVSIKTGRNMSSALRGMSEQFRLEKNQVLEKRAQEAPVKMMVPMVLFIFPTVFIVLFGPIIISFINGGYF